jgi:hypothetical protein
MSRNQFVRNTVQAIQSQIRTGPNLARASTPDLMNDDASSAHAEGSEGGLSGSTLRSRPKRSSSVHSWTSVSRDAISNSIGTASTAQLATSPTGLSSQNASTASVQTPTSGQNSASAEPRIRTAASQSSGSVASIVYGRSWDVEMESLLRVSGEQIACVMALIVAFRTCTLPSRAKKSGNQQGSSRHLAKCLLLLPIPPTIPLCGIEVNEVKTAWLY